MSRLGPAATIGSASWWALGTGVRLLVADGDVEPARRAVVDILAGVDEAYSRFRPDSELSRLNAIAVSTRDGASMAVSPIFGLAIDAALRAGRLSDGAVDPTVGRAMRLIGYDTDFRWVRGRTEPLVLRFEPIPGWRAVMYDRDTATVRLRPGVELDLGSTGKALAADLCAEAARAAVPGGGVLVSLGGDIATAGRVPAGGWRVLATDESSTEPEADGEVVAIHGGAMATSGTVGRRWARDGIALHHLIDPQTGLPVDGPWRTASVVAATCVDANTAATAAIVRGAAGPEWVRTTGLAARLVSTNGDVVRLNGWPEPLVTVGSPVPAA